MGFNDNDFFTEESNDELTGSTNETTTNSNNIIYEEEGFKGYVKKYRRSKWFFPTIILLVLLLIFAIVFRIWIGSTGTLKEIKVNEITKIYLGETTKITATAKGSGNLSKTTFHYEINPTNIAFLETLAGLTGKSTTNRIHPIITGKVTLSVFADLEENKTQNSQQEIVICKHLDKSQEQEIELAVDAIKQIPIDVGTETFCYESLNYEIKDPSIATRDITNKIRGKAVGKTELVITDQKDTITIPIVVKEDLNPIHKISFNQSNKEIKVGNTENLNITIEPADTKEDVYWKSSNEQVATVTAGKVTAISEGTAIITASNSDGSINATIKINVVAKNNSTTKPSTSPTTPSISYSVVMKSNGSNEKYAKNGDTIQVIANFQKKLQAKPQITIGGIEATVSGSGKKYDATVKVTNAIKEGTVSLKINYQYPGSSIKTISSVTKGSAVTVDRTNPRCVLNYKNNVLSLVGSDTSGIKGYLINQSSATSGTYGSGKQMTPTNNGTYYGHVVDNAGNYGTCSYQITSIGDITPPRLEVVTMKSSNSNRYLAKIGDTITVTLKFNEELSTTPSVGISDHSAVITKVGSKTYRATVKVDSSYRDGYVYLSISDYKDLAGNKGVGRTTVTDNSVVTIKK